jgi:hypothetical protein
MKKLSQKSKKKFFLCKNCRKKLTGKQKKFCSHKCTVVFSRKISPKTKQNNNKKLIENKEKTIKILTEIDNQNKKTIKEQAKKIKENEQYLILYSQMIKKRDEIIEQLKSNKI